MDDDRIELTKENLPKKNYGKFILKGPLAVECFVDLVGVDQDKEETINTMYDNLGKYRKLKQELAKKEEKLVNEIMDVIFMLGKENFIFYNDGDIEHDCYSTRKDD